MTDEELTAATYVTDLRALGFKVEMSGANTFGLWREDRGWFGPDYTALTLRYGKLLSQGGPAFYAEICAVLAREISSPSAEVTESMSV